MTERRGRLIVICGLPGSGKTTRARSIAKRLDAVCLSPDDWMDALTINLWDSAKREAIEQLQWSVARDVLRQGGTAVIEWGTWSRPERDVLREGARALGAAVELIALTADPETLFARIDRRGREDPPITLDTVRAWTTAFEVPTAEEMALYDPAVDGHQ